jgi:hypothetical protein
MKRHLHGAAVAAAMVLLTLSAPALAASDGQSQSATAAQKSDDGWKVVLYPVYGWLPIYGADVKLPEVPDRPGGGGGSTVPEASSDSSLDQAVLAAARVEKGRFALEGGFLYAGLEGERERPILKLEANTSIGDLRAGYEVVPDLYLEAGARYLGIEMKATIADFPARSWNPDILEPVLGLSYRPMVGKHWRLILHGDVGGLVTGDSTTAVATAKLEWQPLKHFMLVLGGTVMYLKTEGTIGPKDVKLEQTLYGPIIGFGIPF